MGGQDPDPGKFRVIVPLKGVVHAVTGIVEVVDGVDHRPAVDAVKVAGECLHQVVHRNPAVGIGLPEGDPVHGPGNILCQHEQVAGFLRAAPGLFPDGSGGNGFQIGVIELAQLGDVPVELGVIHRPETKVLAAAGLSGEEPIAGELGLGEGIGLFRFGGGDPVLCFTSGEGDLLAGVFAENPGAGGGIA